MGGEKLMCYLWEMSDDFSEKYIGEYNRDCSPDRFIFKQGEKIQNIAAKPVFNFELKKKEILKIDCLPNNTLVPLINKKIATLLQDVASEDIQLYDAEIHTPDGIVDGYMILNVVNTIVGLDKENSIIEYMSDGKSILGFEYLQYKEGAMETCHLARDSEYTSNLLISEYLAKLLISKKFKGLNICLPEDVW